MKRLACLSVGFTLAVGAISLLGTNSSGALAAPSAWTGAQTRTLQNAPTLKTQLIAGTGVAGSFSVEDMKELKNLARDSSTPIETLLIRYASEGEFEPLVEQLRLAQPDEFVDAGYDMDKPGTVWARFRSEPTPATLESLKALPGEVRVEWGTSLTSAQVATLTEDLYQAVRLTGVATAISSEFLPASNSIQISYKPRGITSGLEDAARAISGVIATLRPGVPTIVARADSTIAAAAELSISGGSSLTVGGQLHCTGGYTVKRGTSTGIITAKHCDTGLEYYGRTGVIQWIADSPDQVDLQFHRVINGNTAGTTFKSDTNTSTQVAYGQNGAVGTRVCVYGIGTNYQRCSTVRARNVSYDPPGYHFIGLTGTSEYITTRGDSGGPWFSNDVARGVHSGVYQDDYKRSIYTPWTRFAESMDSTLVTGGD